MLVAEEHIFISYAFVAIVDELEVVFAIRPISIGGYIYILHKVTAQKLFFSKHFFFSVFQNEDIVEVKVFDREVQLLELLI